MKRFHMIAYAPQLLPGQPVRISRRFRSRLAFLAVGWLLMGGASRAALSPQATVSVLTVSPGAEVYDAFGHTGLWVSDPVRGIDRVYGYGTYDFNAPTFYGILKFYVEFVQGQPRYTLSVIDINAFLLSYRLENRSVTEQVLTLSLEQKERLYAFLEKNYRPENRTYPYKFFFDNCTTRVRDVLQSIIGQRLRYSPPTESRSFRQWIDRYLPDHAWMDFGMDLGLGDRSDRPAMPYESMFLPFNLKQGLAQATVDGKPLVRQTRELFKAVSMAKEPEWMSPAQAFWLLFAGAGLLTAWQWRTRKAGYTLDRLLFALAGLLGVVLVFLWFFTNHGVTAHNWNLAWAWPLHLVVVFLLGRQKQPAWLRAYFLVYSLVVGLLVLGWRQWPQELDAELIPLVLTLGVRAVYRFSFFQRMGLGCQSGG